MGTKVWECPNCTALNVLPQVDADGADVRCVHCKLAVHITDKGKLEHEQLAPKS